MLGNTNIMVVNCPATRTAVDDKRYGLLERISKDDRKAHRS